MVLTQRVQLALQGRHLVASPLLYGPLDARAEPRDVLLLPTQIAEPAAKIGLQVSEANALSLALPKRGLLLLGEARPLFSERSILCGALASELREVTLPFRADFGVESVGAGSALIGEPLLKVLNPLQSSRVQLGLKALHLRAQRCVRLGERGERFTVLGGEPFARFDFTLSQVTGACFEGALRLCRLLLALRDIREVTLGLRLRGLDLRFTLLERPGLVLDLPLALLQRLLPCSQGLLARVELLEASRRVHVERIGSARRDGVGGGGFVVWAAHGLRSLLNQSLRASPECRWQPSSRSRRLRLP